jgi:transposase
VLFTGIAWRHLPRELGCSPATAHRRLQEWQRAGLWTRLHRELLRRLNAAGRIDWSQAVIDGSYVRALQGGLDRALPGRPCPHGLQTLRTRYERLAELHLAFLELGCAIVCQRMLGWP